jgi:hypothetical protein
MSTATGAEHSMGFSALSSQIAGTHYKDMPIQPIEFIQKNGLSYAQGSIIKYICRYKNKNGKEDLKKAIHFIELLMEMEYSNPPATIYGEPIFENGRLQIFKKGYEQPDMVWSGLCGVVDCDNGNVLFEGSDIACRVYVKENSEPCK